MAWHGVGVCVVRRVMPLGASLGSIGCPPYEATIQYRQLQGFFSSKAGKHVSRKWGITQCMQQHSHAFFSSCVPGRVTGKWAAGVCRGEQTRYHLGAILWLQRNSIWAHVCGVPENPVAVSSHQHHHHHQQQQQHS
jgi:hypothetical protein